MTQYAIAFGLIALTVVATILVIAFAVGPSQPAPVIDLRGAESLPRRLRLSVQLLFVSRSTRAVALDAVVIGVEETPHDMLAPEPGLPFALAVRLPDTAWFAERVDELLAEWAATGQPVTLELVECAGRLRTTLTSVGSSVHLDLADTAGLPRALAA